MWTHYAFVVAYSDFFLGYVALFAISLFTLLSGVVRTDPNQIYDALEKERSTRLYVGFLGVAAVGLASMWLFDIVPALLADELPSGIAQFGPEAAHTYVVDLGILVPVNLCPLASPPTAVGIRLYRSVAGLCSAGRTDAHGDYGS